MAAVKAGMFNFRGDFIGAGVKRKEGEETLIVLKFTMTTGTNVEIELNIEESLKIQEKLVAGIKAIRGV